METKLADLVYTREGKRHSLHRQVLDGLIEGDQLSVVSCLQKYRTIELRKIISDLRALNIPIIDHWQKTPGGKRYKIYYLKSGNESGQI